MMTNYAATTQSFYNGGEEGRRRNESFTVGCFNCSFNRWAAWGLNSLALDNHRRVEIWILKEEGKMSRTQQNECWNCIYKRNVPRNYHIRCSKPDPKMTGSPHGISMGWFGYPDLFDPVWKTKLCDSYEREKK